MNSKKFQTPNYAVIFTSKLKMKSKAYEEMASKMFSLAQEQQGFLGI